MTDPEKRLRYLVSLIGPVLLPGWTIQLHVRESLPVGRTDAANGYGKVGQCVSKWEYEQCDLYFGLDMFSELAPRRQTEFVLHELLHAMVNEMRTRGAKHEERVVSSLTSAIMRALQTPAIRKELR